MVVKYFYILIPALIIISLLKRPNVLQLKKVIFYFTTLVVLGLGSNTKDGLTGNIAIFILLTAFICLEILANIQKIIRNEKNSFSIDDIIED